MMRMDQYSLYIELISLTILDLATQQIDNCQNDHKCILIHRQGHLHHVQQKHHQLIVSHDQLVSNKLNFHQILLLWILSLLYLVLVERKLHYAEQMHLLQKMLKIFYSLDCYAHQLML